MHAMMLLWVHWETNALNTIYYENPHTIAHGEDPYKPNGDTKWPYVVGWLKLKILPQKL